MALAALMLALAGVACQPAPRSLSVDDMVLIPAGTFGMGGPSAWERPQRTVDLPAYYIDRNLVTRQQFGEFLLASGRRSRPELADNPRLPAVGVTFADARAYARWRGKRLPTEAEWEKAARGTDRRTWPWGNRFEDAHIALGKPGVAAASSSPYGVQDMVAYVFQWTSDDLPSNYWRDYPNSSFVVQPGPLRVVKGGCWLPRQAWTHAAFYFAVPESTKSELLGFRCAADAPAAADAAALRERSRRSSVPKPQSAPLEESLRQVLMGGGDVSESRVPMAKDMMAFMQLQAGNRVADIGCGSGFFSYQMSKVVGISGRVFAVDIDPNVLEFVQEAAPSMALPNVTTVRSQFTDVSLAPDSIDVCFVYPTYSYLIHRRDAVFGEQYRGQAVPFLQSIRKALVVGGRLAIFDYRGHNALPARDVVGQVQQNGFVLDKQSDEGSGGRGYYSLLFRKS